MRGLLTAAAAVLAATTAAAEPRSITFADLPDPVAQDFADPFKEMGLELLEELRTVVRLEERLAAGEVPEEARPRLEADLAEARGVLEANRLDIDQLLAQRWDVAAKRRRAVFATNPDLAEKTVSLAGFLIPAGTDESGNRIGYLVQQVGMCSHIPPPPPNQLVRITMSEDLPTRSLYEPVAVKGVLRPKSHDTNIFLLDGEVRMVSSWLLETPEFASVAASAGDVPMPPWLERIRTAVQEGVQQRD